MAIKTPSQLKVFFETGKFPTQQQFADLIDSLRHVNTPIEVGEVTDLVDILNTFATVEVMQASLPNTCIINPSLFDDWTMNWSGNGVVREVVLKSEIACEVTIRKNGIPATDFTIEVPANTLVLHGINMPVEDGSTLSFINITNEASIRASVYFVAELFVIDWG
jgi:hypothetical protein